MTAAFTQTTDEVLAGGGTALETGLEEREAKQRQARYGPNRLRAAPRRSAWSILIEQAKSLVFLLLLLAAALSFTFSEAIQGAAILVALLLNIAIGFVTELKATRSMEALQELERIGARVRRCGEVHEISADELVPGDIVLLEAGDLVPADLRLLTVSNLRCDEASLTGESVPVGKATGRLEPETPLAERKNMAFKGTAVANGSGAGVVVAIGPETELGRIAKLAERAKEQATPLERRLEQLARWLLLVIVIVAVATAAIGVAAGRELTLMIETGIALIVAAIPEGLPVVASIALARGMWRLARRNALIERLGAVETLGAVNVICTDKTGTLTENHMTVKHLALADAEVQLDGGELRCDGQAATLADDLVLRAALEVGVLCNAAELAADGAGRGRGDPMELALLAAASELGLDRGRLRAERPEVRKEAFDPKVKMMATFHATRDGAQVAVKGAPEAVLEVCSKVRMADGKQQDLDAARRRDWVERNRNLAASGLRALALATKTVDDQTAAPYQNLTLLGLVGLLDPARAGVADAVRACRGAGIRVVMVTGDQPATAQSIARAVGLIDDDDATVIRGRDLKPVDQMSAAEREAALRAPIFARVDPAQKLDLIELHQRAGARVAMTGDGVNDAPALKKADIGIAMGQRGTQVAKEAADIVLKDDSFATIVTAIAQGRAIFDNIRRFIVYMLSGNTGEIFAVSTVALLNAPLLLLPLQILYINLVCDVFPALALGVGKADGNMAEPPRDPKEPILTRRHWLMIGGYGLLIGATVLAVFATALVVLDMPERRAVTVAFLTFAFARLWHVFNMRDPGSDLLRNTVTTNPWAWAAIAAGALMLFAALYLPLLARVLSTVEPGPQGWALVALGSLLPLLVGQALKGRRPRRLLPTRAGLAEPSD
jgi:P-type Ca2+ transporter type 2C